MRTNLDLLREAAERMAKFRPSSKLYGRDGQMKWLDKAARRRGNETYVRAALYAAWWALCVNKAGDDGSGQRAMHILLGSAEHYRRGCPDF